MTTPNLPVRPRQSRSLTLITGQPNAATVVQPAADVLWDRTAADVLWDRMSDAERDAFVLIHLGQLWDRIESAINARLITARR
jgi:hypothetical protein